MTTSTTPPGPTATAAAMAADAVPLRGYQAALIGHQEGDGHSLSTLALRLVAM